MNRNNSGVIAANNNLHHILNLVLIKLYAHDAQMISARYLHQIPNQIYSNHIKNHSNKNNVVLLDLQLL